MIKASIARSFLTELRRFSTLPEFTANVYGTKRKSFSSVQESDLSYFKSVLGDGRVLTDDDDVAHYNVDWMNDYRGASNLVLKPKTTDEVSKILKYCNQKKLAICPFGGNTGLAGGSIPVFDEIILSMEQLNKVIEIDAISGTLVCEAGCILENLQNELKNHNLMMPIDLGAKGSCQIGGNVSTNAGGLRLLRYGGLHGNVLGIEAVKADGEVLDCLRTLKKDNTGYHLKHLFIGSEGTLGIVTKVAIQCPPLPKAVNLAFVSLKSFEDILKVYVHAKSSLGEIISAFEMADEEALQPAFTALNISNPLSKSPFYAIIETSGSDDKHDNEKLTRFLEDLMDKKIIVDGTVTNEPSKMAKLWNVRDAIPTVLQTDGHLYCFDVSVDLHNYYSLLPMLREKFGPRALKICGFGHIGDSNIHISVTKEHFDKEFDMELELFIFENVSKLRGSISAEHGVGFRKRDFIHFSKSPASIKMMRDMKQIFDPYGILNPYKMIPQNV